MIVAAPNHITLAGNATIDTQARTAINAILTALINGGIMKGV